MGLNAEKSGDVGRIMIVAITDGRANITLKRSTDPEGIAPDAPRPTSQELKVKIQALSLSLRVSLNIQKIYKWRSFVMF